MDINELLRLPWSIQLAVGSGYASYAVAYAGIRGHHGAMDVTAITVVFSLVASVALWVGTGLHLGPIVAGGIAFTASLVAGVIWRKWGRDLYRWLLKASDISWADDDPSVLATFAANTRVRVSQIAVQTDDGTWLSCDDTTKFQGAPFGPLCLGQDGGVAFYLTHEERPGEPPRALTTVQDGYYGARITYIPPDQIRRIAVRHAPV